jgi:hypothetical protein
MPAVVGPAHPLPTPPGPAVQAGSTDSSVPAVYGLSLAPGSAGPIELPGSGTGVVGTSGSGTGVYGGSDSGVGLQGSSNSSDAVQGTSKSPQHAGVSGVNDSGGFGVWARGSPAGHFESSKGFAVEAVGTDNVDIDTINSQSASRNHAAVAAWNNSGGFGLWASSMVRPGPETPSVGGIGLYAQGATYAALFQGLVQVNGDGHVTGVLTVDRDIALPAGAADCAEEFEVAPTADAGPGTVMVLTESAVLEPSQNPYDKRVAGIVSGAGGYRPGVVLDRQGSSANRVPIALVGKVYCKVDAQYGAIEVGDLLTTSATPGHAMKAADPLRAFGAVIGKALRALSKGQGLVPVLIALQ